MFFYILRHILETDAVGKECISDPMKFVRDVKNREHFRTCLKNIVNDIEVDVSDEVAALGDEFDYRGKLRDEEWVSDLRRRIVAENEKMLRRNKVKSFSDEWSKGAA